MKSPCLNCAERHYLCHSKCEKYINWKEEYDRLKRIDRLNRHSTTLKCKSTNSNVRFK